MKARDVPIIDVVQTAGVALKQRGSEYWGLCPFHADSNPSLCVNVSKNVWLCRSGCGGGSPVDFVMKLHGLDFRSACLWIESSFDIKREWHPATKTPAQIQHERERAIEEEIEQTFIFCFQARQALKTELRRRGDNPPEQMIRDIGLFETISAEIASADPERVALGLVMFRRWKTWAKASLQAC